MTIYVDDELGLDKWWNTVIFFMGQSLAVVTEDRNLKGEDRTAHKAPCDLIL